MSYVINKISFREMMKRCKGNIELAKKDILAGLSLPETFRELTILNKDGEVKEIKLESGYADDLLEIVVVDR